VVADVLPGIESVKQSTSCDTADGEILFRLDYGTVAYQYSINGGSTWQNSPRFVGLAPGVYHPVRRSLQGDCQEQLDSIRIGTVDCAGGPVAYFLQRYIQLNATGQVANIRFEVVTPAWYRDSFSLRVRLDGDGKPHLNDGTRANSNAPELRGDTTQTSFIERTYHYVGAGTRQETLVVPLSDSAHLYHYPADYYFHLEGVGPKASVDRNRDLTIVAVNFTGPESEEIVEVTLCYPCQPIGGKHKVPGATCYIWQNVPRQDLDEQPICKPGDYTRIALDANLKVIKKTIFRVSILNLSVSIAEGLPSGTDCKPGDLVLKANVEPESARERVTYRWSTGETTPQIVVRQGVTRYIVTITDPATNCSVNTTYDVKPKTADCKIKDYFIRNGFFAIPISNVTPIPSPAFNGNQQSGSCPDLSRVVPGTGVIDLARKAFSVNSGFVSDPEIFLSRFLNKASSTFEYPTATGQISENENFCCESYISKLEARFNASQLGYWMHIWEGECDVQTQPILFLKAKMPDGKKYPDGALDHAYLRGGLEYFALLEERKGPNLLMAITDHCLDNFVDEKTPDKFNHLIPLQPSEINTLIPAAIENAPDRFDNPNPSLPGEINTLFPGADCWAGFNKPSMAVITPSAQLVMTPQNAWWRFRTPKNDKFVDGALSGFSVVDVVSEAGVTKTIESNATPLSDPNGLKPSQMEIIEKRTPAVYKWKAFYEARTTSDGTRLKGYLDSRAGNNETLYPVFEFAIPLEKPKHAYIGKLQLSDRIEYNNLIDIRKIPLRSDAAFVAYPSGPLTKNLGIGSSVSVKTFYLNPQDLIEVAAGISSKGSDVSNLRIGFYRPFGANASLKPGIMFFVSKNGKQSYLYFTPDHDGVPGRKYEWNCTIASWEEMDEESLIRYSGTISLLQQLWPVFYKRDQIHQILQLTTYISVVGIGTGVANGILYMREGYGDKGKWEIFFAGIDALGTAGEALSILKTAKSGGRVVGAVWSVAGPCGGTTIPLQQAELRGSTYASDPCAILTEKILESFRTSIGKLSIANAGLEEINEVFSQVLKADFHAGQELMTWFRGLDDASMDGFAKILNEAINGATKLKTDELTLLFKDLKGNNALFKEVVKESNLLLGWKTLYPSVDRLDIDILTFFSDNFVLDSRRRVIPRAVNFPNLLVEEATAIFHYTTNAYLTLNEAIRNFSLDKFHSGFAKLIVRGLSKMTPHSGSVVFRGVYGQEARIAEGWTVGKTINFPDFKSASLSEQVAQDFASKDLLGKGVVYQISNPKAYNISGLSQNPEFEILFGLESRFIVTYIDPDYVLYPGGPKTLKIYMDFIP
jgi:hypothetical protein